MKKWLEGAALELPPGLTRPGPCKPEFWKNDLPANLFLLRVLPQKCNKVTPAFSYVQYKHTFWHVFQKLRHVWVSYISWYVLGSISLTSTNICTTVRKKTQWYVEKCDLLSETTFLPYLWQRGVFSFTKVCVFFYQWCSSCFSSQQYMFLWFL